jgi:molybdopterin/thiamine biosynthesis adenylyltransferase
LTPAFVATEVAKARRENLAAVFFHTHPFARHATFSRLDNEGELALREFMDRRIPGLPHAAIVIGQESHSARLLGTSSPCTLEVVGKESLSWNAAATVMPSHDDPAFDRQVRLFGREAQTRLAGLTVGIVGLGGTGSFIANELAHLGVQRFFLLDPDTVEPSNLNRIIGGEPTDAEGLPKVNVAARSIRRIRPNARVEAICASVLLQRYARELTSVDVVFGCTDSHGSRYVLNQLAYQFLIPVFDIGVAIAVSNRRLSHVFGRSQMLAPGLPCLTCLRTLDPEQVRRDLMSDFERQQDPYVIGDIEPQPAVVSLNGTVSSLAVTMFLAAYTGLPLEARHQLYDAIRGMVRPVAGQVDPRCVTCSPDGAFARGDSWPMPGRTG